MRGLLVLSCFSVLLAGVFGANVTVSVMKGDNVTLLINPEEIKTAEHFYWKFENTNIATIDLEVTNSQAEYPDKRFRGRLNLDRNTGSLTINNIRTEDTGVYKLEITSSGKPKHKTFSVTVNDEPNTFSVMKGDAVTLPADVKIQPNAVKWKFNGNIIAGLTHSTLSNMKVNPQTGELNITNIKLEQFGEYEVEINASGFIIQRIFHVNVNGVFGADVTVSVMKGDSVTLPINPEEIKTAEYLLWKFENTYIATIDLEVKTSEEYPDERFTDRLNLDRNTGYLIINNIKTEDTGVYQLEIRSSMMIKYKTFSVTVNEVESESGVEGGSVNLNTKAKTQADDVIVWKFKNTPIAKMDRTAHPHPDPVLDKRFKGRLHVDVDGSLIIRNIRTNESGLYDVNINNSKDIIHKRFSLTVTKSTSGSHQEKIGPGLFVVVIMLVTALVMPVTGDD